MHGRTRSAYVVRRRNVGVGGGAALDPRRAGAGERDPGARPGRRAARPRLLQQGEEAQGKDDEERLEEYS